MSKHGHDSRPVLLGKIGRLEAERGRARLDCHAAIAERDRLKTAALAVCSLSLVVRLAPSRDALPPYFEALWEDAVGRLEAAAGFDATTTEDPDR